MEREEFSVQPSQKSLAEARKASDDWTSVVARRERKQIQNRLNQRARRRRTAPPSKELSGKRSFRVDRWRINELISPALSSLEKAKNSFHNPDLLAAVIHDSTLEVLDSVLESSSIKGFSGDYRSKYLELVGSSAFETLSTAASAFETSSFKSSVVFPLSSDHLLHLIHYNVLRAIMSNKAILHASTTLSRADNCFPTPYSTSRLCDGVTMINLVHTSLPLALYPTQLQRSHPHSSWMNVFPCSRFRDNLIKCEGTLDSEDLFIDLIGELFYGAPSFPDSQGSGFESSERSLLACDQLDYDMDVSARRRGLIVWGNPWSEENWEATPGFLRKWGWLLNGCDGLIAASNHWRSSRGEEPLQRELVPLLVAGGHHEQQSS